MKCIAVGVVAIAVAVAAQGATAGTAHQSSNIAALQAQVKTLAAQVKTLQASVKKLQADAKTQSTSVGDLAAGITVISGCQTALVADVFQGTWAIVDQMLVASGKPALWGPQAAVNDYGWCALLKNTSIVHGISNPPSVTSFSALIALLHG